VNFERVSSRKTTKAARSQNILRALHRLFWQRAAGKAPTVSYNDPDWKPNGPEPTCDISMKYGAFTNDSLTTMYEVVRGALDADDTLKARGEEIRFRVRETAE
jgi:hypothetical protein